MRYLLTLLAGMAISFSAMGDIVTDLRPVINEAAAEHGVDPVLMEAIMRLESGHGTSSAARNKNNLAGIMGRKGPRRYESKEECVRDLARLLGKYKAQGRVTVAQIARLYCTSYGAWTRNVTSNMSQIRQGKWGKLEGAQQEAAQ